MSSLLARLHPQPDKATGDLALKAVPAWWGCAEMSSVLFPSVRDGQHHPQQSWNKGKQKRMFPNKVAMSQDTSILHWHLPPPLPC